MKCTNIKRFMKFFVSLFCVGILFQNCAKNPNLANYSTGQASTSSNSPGIPTTVTVTLPTFQQSPSPTYTVNAGQNLTIEAPASGGNLTYQWLFNGQSLTSGVNGYVFNVSGFELDITNATTNDSGNYVVTVSNSVGSISASFSVEVVNSAPGPTSGPTSGPTPSPTPSPTSNSTVKGSVNIQDLCPKSGFVDRAQVVLETLQSNQCSWINSGCGSIQTVALDSCVTGNLDSSYTNSFACGYDFGNAVPACSKTFIAPPESIAISQLGLASSSQCPATLTVCP